MAETTPARAVGYARVSTQRQADEGLSLDVQESRMREHAVNAGMIWGGCYTDAGISGRRADKRPALQEMLADARAGSFDLLVIPALDRLGRNSRDLADILDDLQGLGIGVK